MPLCVPIVPLKLISGHGCLKGLAAAISSARLREIYGLPSGANGAMEPNCCMKSQASQGNLSEYNDPSVFTGLARARSEITASERLGDLHSMPR